MTVLHTLRLIWYFFEFSFEAIWYKLWGGSGEDRDEEDVRGRVIVVTDGNSRIGKSLSMKLADRGATIILGCRNMTKGKDTQEDIMYETKSRKVFLLQLDLASFSSVRQFADQVTKQFPQIHILINNAEICKQTLGLETCQQGYEKHMCINHLGHFLLTNLLLPNLQVATPSRVVVTSSSTMLFSDLNADDITLPKHLSPSKTYTSFATNLSYNNSKMANCLFANELGRRLRGQGVTTYSVCSGICDTQVFGTRGAILMAKLWWTIIGLSPARAADSILYCVLSRRCENETGKFYRFEKLYQPGNRKIKTEAAKTLWIASDKAVKYYMTDQPAV